MEMNEGASLAFSPTVWASPTFSSEGTNALVTTVSANQASTMGSDSSRMACAIFDRPVGAALIGSPAPLYQA
jgi:hypothetical protein